MKMQSASLSVFFSMLAFSLLSITTAWADTSCPAHDSTCLNPVKVTVASANVAVDTQHCVQLTETKSVLVLGNGGGNISQYCPQNMVMQSEYDEQGYGLHSGAEVVQATCCPLKLQYSANA